MAKEEEEGKEEETVAHMMYHIATVYTRDQQHNARTITPHTHTTFASKYCDKIVTCLTTITVVATTLAAATNNNNSCTESTHNCTIFM